MRKRRITKRWSQKSLPKIGKGPFISTDFLAPKPTSAASRRFDTKTASSVAREGDQNERSIQTESGDHAIVTKAVLQDGMALHYATSELRADEELMQVALAHSSETVGLKVICFGPCGRQNALGFSEGVLRTGFQELESTTP